MSILSLGIVLFNLITKWWYVIPIDARESQMLGFPLPYVCDAWHTSMAKQYFVFEFLVDWILYLIISWLLIKYSSRTALGMKIWSILNWPIHLLSTLLVVWAILWLSDPNHLFYWTRNFEFETLDSGLQWFWGSRNRP